VYLSSRFTAAAVFALAVVLALVIYFLTTTADGTLLLQQLTICFTLGELIAVASLLKALVSLDDGSATLDSDAGAFAYQLG
jgi:sugar phosphate permease